jgi:hypothetical protein
LKYLANWDLNQNQLLNAVLQKLATAPADPVSGQIYYNTTSNTLQFHNGTTWKNASEMTGADIVTAINGSTSIIAKANLPADVIAAVTNSHTHANKTLLDTYTQTEANIADAVSKKHSHSNASVLNATEASFTSAQEAKLGYISVLAAIDLDALKSDVAANNAKVTNATHDGDVTGATTLTIAANAVTNAKMAQVATATIKGRATTGTGNVEDLTAAQVRTLLNVESGADVTDAANVGTAIYGATAKTTMADADQLPLIDSAASNALKKITYANLKVAFKAYTDTLYNNYSHPTGDGNLHVPATSTTNSGKVLTAGATAGSLSWATPGADWSNVTNKPASTVSAIDAAVTNSHTHANEALLDTYTQTNANIADAVSKKHAQNTDTGTSSATYTIGSSGVKIKNSSGTELQVRNNADTAYADLRIKNLYIEGDTTQINSNIVNIGDSEIELNTDITTAAANSDGGITVKRLAADNTTRKDAKMTYNNSTNRWQTTQGPSTGTLTTAIVANKVVAAIGDGSATSIAITHNLNTRDLAVSIRETASPYSLVMTDVEFTDANTITLKFAVAPTASQFTVTIVG